MLSAFLQVLAAYLFVDLATGLYHLATDKGCNFAHQVKLFTLHHDTNTMDGFDWQPSVIGVPAMLLGLWLGSSFLIAGGAFGILSQVPHYYAHRRSDSELVHHFVRILQLTRLIISPQHHAAHHTTFERNFCIVSGWNNYWLNHVVAAFEWHESETRS
jgi:hypothetical protein